MEVKVTKKKLFDFVIITAVQNLQQLMWLNAIETSQNFMDFQVIKRFRTLLNGINIS